MVTFRLLRRDVQPRRVAQEPFVTRQSRYRDASAPAALVGGTTRSNFCVRTLRPEVAQGAIVVRHVEGNGIVLRYSLTAPYTPFVHSIMKIERIESFLAKMRVPSNEYPRTFWFLVHQFILYQSLNFK